MPRFEPRANDDFSVQIYAEETRFRVVEHPNVPGYTHSMDGRKAWVYRVRNLEPEGNEYALKIMKPRHAHPSLARICRELDQYKGIAGLVVCERRCLSPASAPETIATFPNMKYAILMPWINGQSWFEMLYLGKTGRSVLSRSQSLQLASNLSQILDGLEAAGIAHCDLSPANIIVDPGVLRVELVDVEEMFAPAMSQVESGQGTPGYRHRSGQGGQWHKMADRFGGAIILGEMLGWYDDQVRDVSYGESYFAPEELHTRGCRRLDLLLNALMEHNLGVESLLERAWYSDAVSECPTLAEWREVLVAGRIQHTWEPVTYSSSIGCPFSPFWVSASQRPVAWDETPLIEEDTSHGSLSVDWDGSPIAPSQPRRTRT